MQKILTIAGVMLGVIILGVVIATNDDYNAYMAAKEGNETSTSTENVQTDEHEEVEDTKENQATTRTSARQSATVINSTSATYRQSGAPKVTTGSLIAPTDTTVVVTGVVNPNGKETKYWFEYGTSNSFGSKSQVKVLSNSYAEIATPILITGLSKNTLYYFRLVAENDHGKTIGNFYTFRTSGSETVNGIPNHPSVETRSATNITTNSVVFKGEVTANKAEAKYWFEYGKTRDLVSKTSTEKVGVGEGLVSVSMNQNSLDPNTTYYYRIVASNSYGLAYGAVKSFKTNESNLVATAPQATTRSAVGITTVGATLRGTIDPNNVETRYWFEYSTDPSFGSTVTQSTYAISAGAGNVASEVSIGITGLQSKETYYYRIVSENSKGIDRGERMSFRTK